jgi:hypothetical protein
MIPSSWLLQTFLSSIRVMLIPPYVEEGISVTNHGGEVLVAVLFAQPAAWHRHCFDGPNQLRAPEGSQVVLFTFSLRKIVLAVHQEFN